MIEANTEADKDFITIHDGASGKNFPFDQTFQLPLLVETGPNMCIKFSSDASGTIQTTNTAAKLRIIAV